MSLSKTYGTKLPGKLEKKFLKYVEREGLSPSRALAKAVERAVHPSPNADWYRDKMRKDFMAEYGAADAGELHKAISSLGTQLEKRIERALAKALTQINPNAAFRGSAISQYVPGSASELADGGDPSVDERDGGSNFDPDELNSEETVNTWQGERGEDVSDNEDAPLSKASREALRRMGVNIEPKKKKLSKSQDTDRQPNSAAFTLSSHDFVPEKSAGYQTRGDLPGFLKAADPDHTLRKDDGVTLEDLAKHIAHGDDGQGNFGTEGIAKMFSPKRLRKA